MTYEQALAIQLEKRRRWHAEQFLEDSPRFGRDFHQHCLGELNSIKTQAEEDSSRDQPPDPEPIHNEFELSYAQYLVVPRSALQSMPAGWQARFVEMMRELNRTFDISLPEGLVYQVHTKHRNESSAFCRADNDDPLADYERGRRRLTPRDE